MAKLFVRLKKHTLILRHKFEITYRLSLYARKLLLLEMCDCTLDQIQEFHYWSCKQF